MEEKINICIMGNGFDLYHKLPTTFNDFIEINSSGVYVSAVKNSYQNHNDGKSSKQFDARRDWNNIEEYLACYNTSISREELPKIKQVLNGDFIDYLNGMIVDKINDIDRRVLDQNIIDVLKKQTLIINFNYTDTVRKYVLEDEYESKVFHIHGRLEDNDIIIGQGIASDLVQEVSMDPITTMTKSKEIKMRKNLYSYQYIPYEKYKEFRNEIEGGKKINLTIMGHSLGLTDSEELKRIINSADNITIHIHRKKEESAYMRKLKEIYKVDTSAVKIEFKCDLRNDNILFPVSSINLLGQEIKARGGIFTEMDLVNDIKTMGNTDVYKIKKIMLERYTQKKYKTPELKTL